MKTQLLHVKLDTDWVGTEDYVLLEGILDSKDTMLDCECLAMDNYQQYSDFTLDDKELYEDDGWWYEAEIFDYNTHKDFYDEKEIKNKYKNKYPDQFKE